MRRGNTRFGHGLSERRRRYLVSEERKASREYHAAGLHGLGRDEAKHARFLACRKRVLK